MVQNKSKQICYKFPVILDICGLNMPFLELRVKRKIVS